MLEFPRWKYFLILIVLAVSALYALPNIYQKDPAAVSYTHLTLPTTPYV